MIESHCSDSTSAAELALRMRPALVRFFRRGSSVGEAEDLAQDVLVRCLAHSLQGSPARVQSYLFRAARNRWHDRLRRLRAQGTAVEWDEETVGLPHVEQGPEQIISLAQQAAIVSRRFAELDRRAREVIFWVKVEELPIDTVASKLGVSRSTVNKTLARGLAHLRELRDCGG